MSKIIDSKRLEPKIQKKNRIFGPLCMYVWHQKNFSTDQLKWQYPITGKFCPRAGHKLWIFPMHFFEKNGIIYHQKTYNGLPKKPHYNALLLQFSAVLMSGNLEFSDSFVRLNKINRQTNLISSLKPNPHQSNHRG